MYDKFAKHLYVSIDLKIAIF